MDLQLSGKRALVTGGSRGIGKAIARVLAQEGAQVALLARNPQALMAAAAELTAETGRTVVFVVGDTASDDSVRLAVTSPRGSSAAASTSSSMPRPNRPASLRRRNSPRSRASISTPR